MFSLNYFKYLIKSNRYLILLTSLISLLIDVSAYDDEIIFVQGMLCLILAFVLPVMVFYHAHDKKAIDTYFSIPVSRKELLITSIVFMVAVLIIPLYASVIIYGFRNFGFMSRILEYMLLLLLCVTGLVVFNSTIYLCGNNVIDGVIILGAYTMLPLGLVITYDQFMRAFVCGKNEFNELIFGYLSPVFMSADIFINKLENRQLYIHSIVAIVVVLMLFALLLYRSYVLRKAERAGTPSDKFYTYPTIITIYVFMCLVMIATNYMYYNEATIFTFLKGNFILYVILFAIYMSAHLIYKRKVYFDYKMPILYVVAICITLVFATMAKQTRGFGLSDTYIKSPSTFYSINLSQVDKTTEDKIKEKVKNNFEYTPQFVEIYIEAGDPQLIAKIGEYPLQLLDSLRTKAIDDYYSKSLINEYYRNLYVISRDDSGKKETYSYTLSDDSTNLIDYDTLERLSKERNIKVHIGTDMAYYLLYSGNLIVENQYEYK